MSLLGVPARGLPVQRAGPCETGAALRAQHEVLHDAGRREDAVSVSVLRHVGDAASPATPPSAAPARTRPRRPPRRCAAGGRRRAPSASSTWPLPATPAMPTISPLRDREADVMDCGHPVVVVRHEVTHGHADRCVAGVAGPHRTGTASGRPRLGGPRGSHPAVTTSVTRPAAASSPTIERRRARPPTCRRRRSVPTRLARRA